MSLWRKHVRSCTGLRLGETWKEGALKDMQCIECKCKRSIHIDWTNMRLKTPRSQYVCGRHLAGWWLQPIIHLINLSQFRKVYQILRRTGDNKNEYLEPPAKCIGFHKSISYIKSTSISLSFHPFQIGTTLHIQLKEPYWTTALLAGYTLIFCLSHPPNRKRTLPETMA